MKKFSELKKTRRILEQDEFPIAANLPTETPNGVVSTEVETQDTSIPETGKESGEMNPVNFFSKLFESREMAHIYHLQVRGEEGSFAKHEALGKYYEGVLGFIDEIIEVYQGQYGVVDGYDVIDTKDTATKDAIAYFEDLAEYIKHARKCIDVEDTHIHNFIDEVVALVYKTLYRLKFNK
jgi:hypothetical protein